MNFHEYLFVIIHGTINGNLCFSLTQMTMNGTVNEHEYLFVIIHGGIYGNLCFP